MMDTWDMINAIAMFKRLYDRYETEPSAVACDLLAIIARVATTKKVPLQSMLDAVKRGARAGA